MFRTLKQFIKNEDGNLMIMSAGMALPLVALVGGAIDFSETYKVKSNIRTSAETGVIAAFRNPGESWEKRERRVTGLFKANLIRKDSLKNLNTNLSYHLRDKTTVMTFTVNAGIKSMFGELSPITASNFTIQATAEFDPESRRAPHLVENTSIAKTVERGTSRRKR